MGYNGVTVKGAKFGCFSGFSFDLTKSQILLMLLNVDALRWHLEHLDHDISIGVFPQTRLHVLSISDLVLRSMRGPNTYRNEMTPSDVVELAMLRDLPCE